MSRALDNLSATFKKDAQLQNILTAPTLSDADKKSIIAELQKSLGVTDKTNTVQNFLDTLAENNRLGVLEGVCEKFGTLMSAARGEVEMTITSAAPLDQKVVRQLETAVGKSRYVGQGKKLKVVPKVSSTHIPAVAMQGSGDCPLSEERNGLGLGLGIMDTDDMSRSTPTSAAA